MASLGQQIAGSIENHAQTQAATAMLPALQQSYQQGMQKIADGHPEGMADIYSAAMTASQIPMLAPMATSALNTANSAMQQSMHNIRSKAAQDAITARYAMEHGSDAMPKPMNAYQQEQVSQNKAKVQNQQIDEYGALYEGDPSNKIEGIGALSKKINEAIGKGENVSPEDLQKFAGLYETYKQKQSSFAKNAINNKNIDQAYNDIKGHLLTAQSYLNEKIKSVPEGTDLSSVKDPNANWWSKIWGNDKVDLASQKKNIDDTITNLNNIHRGQTSSQALMQAVQAAKKHPDKIDLIKSRLQGAGIDPSMLDQAIKSQQTQQQSSPQASNMIPAANQTSDNVETEEEE
jgi:hypothetical protein